MWQHDDCLEKTKQANATALIRQPPFIDLLHSDLKRIWQQKRTVALDHLGPLTYGERRRATLVGLERTNPLGQYYGLRTAQQLTPVNRQSGVRINHPLSAEYHRPTQEAAFLHYCQTIYQAQGGKHHLSQVLFVNTISAIEHIAQQGNNAQNALVANFCQSVSRVKPLGPGLVALEMDSLSAARYGTTSLIPLHGLRPSLYAVLGLTQTPSVQPAPKASLSASTELWLTLHRALDRLAETLGPVDRHSLTAASHCALAVLKGLARLIHQKHQAAASPLTPDPLVSNSLNALSTIAAALPVTLTDSPRFDELFLILAAIKVYRLAHFKTACQSILKSRAGKVLAKLKIGTPETFLCSSGMGALSLGVRIAQGFCGDILLGPLISPAKAPDYFEISALWTADAPPTRICTASLHGSTPKCPYAAPPQCNWTIQQLINATLAWLADLRPTPQTPAVLILDGTVASASPDGTTDLANLLQGLHPQISTGSLRLLICKSFQKYTALGSGKIMASAISLISVDDAAAQHAHRQLQAAEADLAWMDNDDSQLLTHCLTHAPHAELELIDQASRNLSWVKAICCEPLGQVAKPITLATEQGLPFLIIHASTEPVRWRTKYGIRECPLEAVICHRTRELSSFAILATSATRQQTPQGQQVRLTIGQESPRELVEICYGLAWLMQTMATPITPQHVLSHAEALTTEAVETIFTTFDLTTWADAALRLLHQRPLATPALKQTISAYASRLSQNKLTPLNLMKDPARRAETEALRWQIRNILADSSSYPSSAYDRLLEKLIIIQSTCPPHQADALRLSDAITAMRIAVRTSDLTIRNTETSTNIQQHALLAPNKIASLLLVTATLWDPEQLSDTDRHILTQLYTTVFKAGVSKLSFAARSQMSRDWSHHSSAILCQADDALSRQSALDVLLSWQSLSPYPEDSAQVLLKLPDETFAALTPSQQDNVITTLCNRLDEDSRIALLNTLSSGSELSKHAALSRLVTT